VDTDEWMGLGWIPDNIQGTRGGVVVVVVAAAVVVVVVVVVELNSISYIL
jgi:hypothetical protein